MKIPPFHAGPASNNLSNQGDEDTRFVKSIRAVWAKAGHAVHAEVVEVGVSGSNTLYGTRSNLVNGLSSGKPVLVRS